MNAKNITETLISDADKLGKTVNVQALVVALVIIAAGVACFFLIGHDRFSASVDMLILLVGVALVVLGAVHAARKYNKVVYLPTNSAVAVAQFSMDAMSKKRVIDSLEKGVLDADSVVLRHGGSLRLDILRSADGSFNAVQVFEFVPYTYSPITEVFYIDGKNADELWDGLAAKS